MTAYSSNWSGKLISHSILERFDIQSENFLRLHGPIEFDLSGEKSRELINNYESGFEKGGIIQVSASRSHGKTILKVVNIKFIQNVSSSPSEYYEPAPRRLKEVIFETLNQELLPLIFHTHPTKSFDILDEIRQYHFQMETSWQDQQASISSLTFNEGKLRLPEVLVIGNGTHKQGLFVGLYGGLVAPLGFKNRRNVILFKQFLKTGGEIIDSIRKPGDQLATVLIALFAVKIALDHPKQTRYIFKEMYELLSPLVYAASEENLYFGLTCASRLKIIIPKPADSFIREEEMSIRMMSNAWNKKAAMKEFKLSVTYRQIE